MLKKRNMNVMLQCVLVLSTALIAHGELKNAVFNGDFEYGTAGWKTIGDSNAIIRDVKFPIQEKVIKAVQVDLKSHKGDFWIYNEYAIKVDQGQKYSIKIRAAGKGTAAIGAIEYNPNFLRSKSFDAISLTDNPNLYDCVYQPSKDATEVRVAVVLPAADSQTTRLILYNVSMDVPAEKFASATEWPQKPQMPSTQSEEYFDNKFKGYTGFSDEQKRKIAESVRVNAIVSPYKAIQRSSPGKFVLTTSEFGFENSVFPASIRVLGGELLAEGVSLNLWINNKKARFKFDKPDISAAQDSVSLSQTGVSDSVTLHLKGELLYDALMIFSVDLDCVGPIVLDRAELEIPLKDTIARYSRYESFWQKPNLKYGFGPIPRPGEKVQVKCSLLNGRWPNYWNPSDSAEDNAVIWKWDEGFLPFFWIGDEEKGLGFIAESDNGWHYKNRDATVVYERAKGRLTARINFVTSPIKLAGSKKIQFAIQATPPKPIRQDWAKIKITGYDIDAGLKRYALLDETQKKTARIDFAKRNEITSFWYSAWSYGCGTPHVNDSDKQYFKDAVKVSRFYGVELTPYLTPTHLAMNSPEGWYYGAKTQEWATKPLSLFLDTKEKDSIVRICTHSFFSEYQAWSIGALIDEYDISGIYFDNCAISPCINEAHGCGYKEGGEVKPTIPFFAVRKFFMMVRNEFLKRGKTPIIICHSGHYPAEISFTDFYLTGEGIYGINPSENLTLGEMRADMLGHNQFGTIGILTPQFNYWPDLKQSYTEEVTRRLMAITLLHGTKIWTIFCNKAPIEASWPIFDLLDEPKIDFCGYWQWDNGPDLNRNGIYASIYKQSNKAILIVSNFSKNLNVTITKSAIKSVFGNFKTAEDLFDKLPINMTAGDLNFEVKENNFRLIMIQ